jgi:hypothetical protein
MATYLNIINQVLVKLREPEVTAPSENDYSAMIGALVNETKREVEDAWRWTSLRQTIAIDTVDGTSTYAITGAGMRFRLQDPLTSIYNATNKHYLTKSNAQVIKKNKLENTSEGIPSAYYFEGFDTSGDPKVVLHRTPDGVYTINYNLVVPQVDLSSGSDTLDTPIWPIVLGTYAKAIAERGEDDGRAHGEALNKYGFALSDSIAIDESLTSDEVTWHV